MTTITPIAITSLELAAELNVNHADVAIHAYYLGAARHDITTPRGRHIATAYALTTEDASHIRAAIAATAHWSAS
jgi:hypothetical protein